MEHLPESCHHQIALRMSFVVELNTRSDDFIMMINVELLNSL